MALYKEAQNSVSVFYRFLSLWKILELDSRSGEDREQWIISTIPTLSGAKEWLAKVPGNPVEYLRDSCRNAISHVRRKPTVHPDNYEDNIRLQSDVQIVEGLAKAFMRSGGLK